MANTTRGEVEIEADGKSYRLLIDWNAVCELEAAFDCRPDELGEHMQSARGMRTFYRIALAHHHPEISEKDAGDIISALGPQKAAQAVNDAFSRSGLGGGDESPARPRKAKPKPH